MCCFCECVSSPPNEIFITKLTEAIQSANESRGVFRSMTASKYVVVDSCSKTAYTTTDRNMRSNMRTIAATIRDVGRSLSDETKENEIYKNLHDKFQTMINKAREKVSTDVISKCEQALQSLSPRNAYQ